MEYIQLLWDAIGTHIDPISVLLVLLGGFFSKRYLYEVNLNNALKTLITGTVFIGVYLIVLKVSGNLNKADYTKYFISYCVATSLYEMLIKKLTSFIGDKFNKS